MLREIAKTAVEDAEDLENLIAATLRDPTSLSIDDVATVIHFATIGQIHAIEERLPPTHYFCRYLRRWWQVKLNSRYDILL